jgi:hypothetical protein
MSEMPRGMLILCIVLILGGIALGIVLSIIDPPPNLGGAALMAYAAAMGIAIAEYDYRHPEKIPARSKRR